MYRLYKPLFPATTFGKIMSNKLFRWRDCCVYLPEREINQSLLYQARAEMPAFGPPGVKHLIDRASRFASVSVLCNSRFSTGIPVPLKRLPMNPNDVTLDDRRRSIFDAWIVSETAP